MKKYDYCIIGSSAAGIAAAQKLRQLQPEATIACFSSEKEEPYNKCFLADYVAGSRTANELYILKKAAAEQKNIALYLDCTIQKIDPLQQCIIDLHGDKYLYEKLLIATGAMPVMPPIEHLVGSGSFSFHTRHDIEQILLYAAMHKVKHITIIGGGLTGIEAADALSNRGFTVTIIEAAPHILSTLIDADAAAYIQKQAQLCGVNIISATRVAALQRSKEHLAIQLLAGVIQTDLVIWATGQRPCTHLARDADLAMHNGYLLVDEYQRTSNIHIFAAGDCVLVKDAQTNQIRPSVTWADAMQQGIVAAHTMTGMPKIYAGAISLLTSSFFGKQFVVAGLALTHTMQRIAATDSYASVAYDDNQRVRSFVFVGTAKELLRELRIAFLTR